MVKFTEIQLNKSTMSVLAEKYYLGISGGIAL
jgi:hypothetical protein